MPDTVIQERRRLNRNLVKMFSAVNPTPGTGIAEAVKTAFDATEAMALLRNGAANGIIRPKYIRLINTVVPASGTSAEMSLVIDSGVTRHASGGSTLTATNRDMSSSITSNATCRFGALVTDAATANVRNISRLQLRGTVPVVNDEYVIKFGIEDNAFGAVDGTAANRTVTVVAPVALGPSTEMIVHAWYPSNATTPASWEVEIAWEESLK